VSTFDQLQALGISTGDTVRTPPHKGMTLARAGRPWYSYVQVYFADGSTVMYQPRLLTKATPEEHAAFVRAYEGEERTE
jgi:hypothetical protein